MFIEDNHNRTNLSESLHLVVFLLVDGKRGEVASKPRHFVSVASLRSVHEIRASFHLADALLVLINVLSDLIQHPVSDSSLIYPRIALSTHCTYLSVVVVRLDLDLLYRR